MNYQLFWHSDTYTHNQLLLLGFKVAGQGYHQMVLRQNNNYKERFELLETSIN